MGYPRVAPRAKLSLVDQLAQGALIGTLHLIDDGGRRITHPITAHVHPSSDGGRWDVLDVTWRG